MLVYLCKEFFLKFFCLGTRTWRPLRHMHANALYEKLTGKGYPGKRPVINVNAILHDASNETFFLFYFARNNNNKITT